MKAFIQSSKVKFLIGRRSFIDLWSVKGSELGEKDESEELFRLISDEKDELKWTTIESSDWRLISPKRAISQPVQPDAQLHREQDLPLKKLKKKKKKKNLTFIKNQLMLTLLST